MTTPYKIEPASKFHAELFAELHGQCFEEGWTAAAFDRFLSLPACFASLAVETVGETQLPVGFVLCQGAAGIGDIVTLGVVPAARRCGVASMLVEAALSKAQELAIEEVFLEVAEDNVAALDLYRRCAFRDVGRRPNYYARRDGSDDALVLSRSVATACHKATNG